MQFLNESALVAIKKRALFSRALNLIKSPICIIQLIFLSAFRLVELFECPSDIVRVNYCGVQFIVVSFEKSKWL